MQGYFHYAFSATARSINHTEFLRQVFEADLSVGGSPYDRACELWQQILGIENVYQIAAKTGLSVAEVVYGKEHVFREHHNMKNPHYYKPRYLKNVDPQTGAIYAFPYGLPGLDISKPDFGVKVHLVGHSLGGLTAREF